MTNFKNDIDKHNLMMKCSDFSYNPEEKPVPRGCEVIGVSDPDDKTGFAAVALRHGDEIIVAFRGTEVTDYHDLNADITMSSQNMPRQAYHALMFYDAIKKKYPQTEILLTGHSLGGSLAQIVGVWRKVKACTFNPYGTRNILQKTGINIHDKNIVNYCNPYDTIATKNGEGQIGANYILWSKVGKGSDKPGLYHHYLENNEPIQKQASIDFTKIKYSHNLRNEYYEGQASSIYGNLPPRDVMVHVNAYKRDDGTRVREYWRRYPDVDIISSSKKLSDMSQEELNLALYILM